MYQLFSVQVENVGDAGCLGLRILCLLALEGQVVAIELLHSLKNVSTLVIALVQAQAQDIHLLRKLCHFRNTIHQILPHFHVFILLAQLSFQLAHILNVRDRLPPALRYSFQTLIYL